MRSVAGFGCGRERAAELIAGPGSVCRQPTVSVDFYPTTLIEFLDDGALELYNFQEEIGEESNLAEKLAQKAQSLRAELRAWRESLGAKMPRKNPKYNPQRARQWWSRRSKKPL